MFDLILIICLMLKILKLNKNVKIFGKKKIILQQINH